MILLLLFLISSTLRSSDAQKPEPKNTLCACINKLAVLSMCACKDFFYGVQSIRNATETYSIFFRGFFGWVKIRKMM